MKEQMMPSIEKSSTNETEVETQEKEGSDKLNDNAIAEAFESTDPDLESSRLRAAQELGIDSSKISDTELSEKIVAELDKEEDSKGILSRMPGLRNFVKAAVLTVGIGMAGGGLANRSFAAEGPENGKADSTMVDSNETQEKRVHEIKAYESQVNDVMEKASMDFGENVTDEQLNNFQQKGWEWAAYVADNGGTKTDFLRGLGDMYRESFAEQLQQLKDARTEEAQQKAEELAPESIDVENIDDAWLKDNVDKTFHDGTHIYVVKSADSLDMQMSVNKAQLECRSILAELINNGNTKDGVSIYGSRSIRTSFNTSKDDRGRMHYHSIVLMELPLAQNIK